MQVHLSRFDIEILRQQALESIDVGDDGESFIEEAITRLEEDDLLVIEELGDVSPEAFFAEVFSAWDGSDPETIIETLSSMLEDLDIELTYDEDDEVDDDDWDDDVDVEEDDEEFEGY